MSQNKRIQFLIVVVFVGILLSITLYLGLDGLPRVISDTDPGERSDLGFNGAFHTDASIQSFVKYCDYKFFRHIESEKIIIGKEDWLFETVRADNGYDYLLDYVGGCPYSEDQMAQFAHTVSLRRKACAERDAEYLLVIIPNSMTAVSDCLPAHIGKQSENTRMTKLVAYLESRGETSVLDLRGTMTRSVNEEVLFNNTEDSINAYGAYSVYDAVMTELSKMGQSVGECRLNRSSIQFFTHHTEGKGVARKAGLERVILNRTVSLSETMADQYRMAEITEHCASTEMSEGPRNSQRLVIECSNEWDKIQLMPYFSNTFETVVYENSIGDGVSALDYHKGDVLIQVIHESELDLLLK